MSQIRQQYDQLQQQEAVYKKLFDLIKNMPEQDALEIVRRLRAGADAEGIINQVRDGTLLIQLSLAPDTGRMYRIPYKSERPGHLFTANNPYLNSFLHDASLSFWVPRGSTSKDRGDQQSIAGSQARLCQTADRRTQHPAARLTRYHSA